MAGNTWNPKSRCQSYSNWCNGAMVQWSICICDFDKNWTKSISSIALFLHSQIIGIYGTYVGME